MRIVFVCHPFAGEPAGSLRRVTGVCSRLAAEGVLPVAPQLYLPQFLDETTQRELALRLCLEMLRVSDEVRVYGVPTEGMRLEIAEAERLGIRVVKVESE